MNFKSHMPISKKLFRFSLLVWMILFYSGAVNLPTARAAAGDFKLVFIPDSQNESASFPQVFNSMTTWLVANKASQNIVFASHMGDIVNTASNTNEWVNASNAMSILDNAQFPYSVGPGNHDVGGLYNDYFGVSRFTGMTTYAGHYGTDNNNNYSLFSASGLDFILINLQYDPTSAMLNWADALYKQYSGRRGILVSHEILDAGGSLSSVGSSIFDALKDNPNLFLMMCGHAGVEYLAEQGTDGHTIHIMMADYEGEKNGGDGYIRILTFSPANDRISATTYSTYDGSSKTSYPDQMDMVYNMHNTTGAFNKTGPLNGATSVATNPTLTWGTSSTATSYEYCYAATSGCASFTNVGTNTSVTLSGLNNNSTYYWQVRAITPGGTIPADGGNYWSFTTVVAAPSAFAKSSPTDGATGQPINPTLRWGASSGATSYEYCYGTSNPCSNWTTTTATSAAISGLSGSSIYYWQVRAKNAGGTTYADGMTAYWSFTTGALPVAFSKTGPANNATGQPVSLTLSWGTSSNASSYDYCYGTANPCSNWTSTGTSTSASLSGLNNNTTYYWQVRAVNAIGTTLADSGTFWSFTTIMAPPGSFNKTSPANNASDQPVNLTLSWGTSGNASSYEYCYGTSNPCSNWTSTGINKSASLSGLSNNTIYYWQVRAVNAGGTTYANGETTDWSFTTAPLPGAFAKVNPADSATGQPVSMTLNWGASSNVNSYEYCYGIANPCSNWASAGTNTSIGLSLNPNTTYYWQVRAVNADGTTYADGVTTDFSFSTAPLPGAFAKASPVDNASGQAISLTLNWGTSSNANSYEYCYGTSTPCSNWTATNTTSASISGLSHNTRYYWQVRAVNGAGNTIADGGAYWSFTTIMAAPGDFSKASPADNASDQPTSLNLNWGASSGAASYEYCYGTANPCSNWTPTTGTSVFISSLSNDTTYFWQARAVNAGGTTPANTGASWSFTTIIAAPGAFSKNSPSNGASGAATNPTLSWGTSDRAASYEYCLGTTKPCSNWTSAGPNTSVALTGLDNSQVYFWQVRAINAGGTILADSGSSWSFTTIVAAPGAFSKTAPLNNATGETTHPILSWEPSDLAESYEYCYAISTGCSNWASTGLDTSVTLSGLIPGQTYTWQVRAVNPGGTTQADTGTYWSFTTIVYRTYLPVQFR